MKARNGSGSVERRGALWWARITATGRPRKRLPMAGSETWPRAQAKREAAKLAADYATGKIVFDETPRSKARPLAAGAAMTVRQVGEAWTNGKLYETYGAVDGLAPRASGYIDGKTLAKHVYGVKTRGPNAPAFGDLSIASVTVDDARAVMGAQRPEEQALQTRRHTYARIRQVFDFAELPLKLRPDMSNPFGKRLRPRKVRSVDGDLQFQYLYPSEAVQLAARTAVLVARRVYYATAMATGFDVSTLSLPEFSWANYDPANRTLYEARPKTSKAVFVYANPAWLFDLLDAWRELSGAPAADAPRDALKAAPIFPADALGWRRGREADALQADLALAKLTRPALIETTAHSHRMRFHDLRATFETWARRAGWDQRDIDARTGHGSKAMAERYDRGARSLAELQEVPFPNLALAIPETRAVLEARLATRLATAADPTPHEGAPGSNPKPLIFKQCEGGDLNPYANYGASTSSEIDGPSDIQSSETPSPPSSLGLLDAPREDVANPMANDEADLRRQIAEAIIAGDDERAAKLTAKLRRPILRRVK
jgi:integrase